MRKVVTDVDDNFYYNCGVVFARKLGDKSQVVRRKYVDEFKKFVDAAGGPDVFPSVEAATDRFFQTFKRSDYGRR